MGKARAVVLGGGGLTGRAAVRQLAAGGRVEEVVAADVDRPLATAAAQAAGPKAVTANLDVRDRAATARLLHDASVVVNATPYTFNLEAMGAALDAGVPYLDFGGLFHTTRRQLELDRLFREAGMLAIPGLGQVPGISNVLAVAAAERLDTVDSIVLRDGWRDLTADASPSFSWSPTTFFDEMVRPAIVFEDGEYREHPPLSGAEEHEFPPPVGRTTVFRTLHSEPATLPETLRAKGLRHCEWKEGGPGIELARSLAQLGLGSDQPLEVGGTAVVPREFTVALLRRGSLLGPRPGAVVDDWEVLDIELRGVRDGKSLTVHAFARFPPWPVWHLAATEYAVGTAGAVGAEMLLEGKIRGAGVLPPERVVPAEPFRAELARRGIPTAIVPPEPPLPER
jgi:saccharopine dehydrogenase-like NADP-dependent oxidoreductase